MCYVSGQFVGSRLSIAIGSAATGVGDYVYVPRLLPSSKAEEEITIESDEEQAEPKNISQKRKSASNIKKLKTTSEEQNRLLTEVTTEEKSSTVTSLSPSVSRGTSRASCEASPARASTPASRVASLISSIISEMSGDTPAATQITKPPVDTVDQGTDKGEKSINLNKRVKTMSRKDLEKLVEHTLNQMCKNEMKQVHQRLNNAMKLKDAEKKKNKDLNKKSDELSTVFKKIVESHLGYLVVQFELRLWTVCRKPPLHSDWKCRDRCRGLCVCSSASSLF